MGWAKYYEDNVSICIGRMAVKEYIPVKPTPVRAHRIDRRIEGTPVCPAFEHKGTTTETSYDDSVRNGGRGLELSFAVSPELRVCRKLQLNGWWWSAVKKCWCNFNTNVNFRYAEETVRRYQAKLTIVVAA
ncbi:MAG: hypothetical protein PUB89_00105 [Oscillospiraceae bacterium]|nr:hypothetical protein [Oscillospiraceae bacterium]MDD6081236.1 hypothetical protein [Oscillospiraceae bacterium]